MILAEGFCMIRLFSVMLLLALVPASSWLAQDDAPTLNVLEYELENGLRVLVLERPGVPVVSTYVWYKVGSMDEVPGQTGMAHFLEHMMFKGSANYKVGEVDAVTARNGGSNNAFTSFDYTAYYIDLPRSRFMEALRIEADRMTSLTLDNDEFEAERQVVQAESDQYADDPSSRLWEAMRARVYGPGHPYSHPILGRPQDVQDVTRRDMRLFYERHYHPNNATLILVGDITGDEAMQAIKPLFEDIPRGPAIERPERTPVDVNGPAEVEVRGDSAVIEVGMEYHTVPFAHPDQEALRILGIILGGGVTSRLYRELVDDKGMLTAVSSGHSGSMLGGGLWVWGQLADAEHRPHVPDAIRGVIAGLATNGPDESELERARTRLIASTVFGQERASSLANWLGYNQAVAGDWRHGLGFADRVRAVTAADVQRVAVEYLKAERSVTGWLVPELTPAVDRQAEEGAAPEALPVERHVLSNGLTVLLYPREGVPVITAEADVRVTRAAETAEQAGLAAFTGGLLDAGTRHMNKQQIAEAMETVGGVLSMNAGGGSVRVLSENADVGINMLLECLRHPVFPEAEVELLRRRTLATLEARMDDSDWFGRAAGAASIWGPDSPLGRPADGSRETVSAFTREDAQAWHERWFTPENTVLAVVGDFDSEEMLQLIRSASGNWARADTDTAWPELEFKQPERRRGEQVFHFRNFRPEQVEQTSRRILIDHPEKSQMVVRVQSLGIPRDHPDYFPLLVMDNIFGSSPGFTDRFSRRLRDEMGLAYSTYANISASAGVYPGSFLGYIATRPDQVELALKTVYELVEQLRDAPVTEDELRAAQDYLKGSFVFGLETTGQLASLLLRIERHDLGFDYLVKYAEGVDAVSVEDVQRVAREWLVPDRMVEVIVGPVTRLGNTD
jgi:zinc protease